MKEKIKTYTLIASFIVIGILLMLRQCDSPKSKETFLKGKEIIKYDTIKGTDTLVTFKKVYYPKWDTSYIDTSKGLPVIQPGIVKVYNDSTVDTNISMYRHLEVLGMIKSEQYSYKRKKPEVIKTISRTDTLVRPNKWDFYINSELGGNRDQLDISIGCGLRYKKAYYGFRYGVLDKTYNATVGFRLFKSEK